MGVSKVITSQIENLGIASLKLDSELKPIDGFWLATPDFHPTIANMCVESTILAAIKAKQLFPLPGLDGYEDKSVADKEYTSPLGHVKITKKGNKVLAVTLDVPFETHKALQSFNMADMKVFELREGKICFYNNGGNATGFSLKNINVGSIQEIPADGSKPALSPITFDYANSEEWNLNGNYVEPTAYDPYSVSSLTNVNIVVKEGTTPSATLLVVRVQAPTGTFDAAGAPEYTQIKGIPMADFTFLQANGTANAITSYVDNGDGTYNLIGTGWTTGTVNLKAPADMVGTDLLIESLGSVAVTIA